MAHEPNQVQGQLDFFVLKMFCFTFDYFGFNLNLVLFRKRKWKHQRAKHSAEHSHLQDTDTNVPWMNGWRELQPSVGFWFQLYLVHLDGTFVSLRTVSINLLDLSEMLVHVEMMASISCCTSPQRFLIGLRWLENAGVQWLLTHQTSSCPAFFFYVGEPVWITASCSWLWRPVWSGAAVVQLGSDVLQTLVGTSI